MAGLASHLESDTIGSGVLELEGGGREVVEILVEELYRTRAEAKQPDSQHPINHNGKVVGFELG